MPGDALLLPKGSILVHIGPPKTGTTAVQGAFHLRRREVLAQGVRYAGRARHSGAAVNAVIGRPSFTRDSGSPPMSRWDELVRDVRQAREPRVLVSSEFFADAEAERIPRIVEDLGRERVHVVVTLRPLSSLLASQWQQYVQSFTRLSFEEWLEGVLNGPPGAVTPTFWRRHRHDALIDRWAAVVGPERVTAVVIEEGDRDHVLRVFEGLLGLRDRTLVADDDATNRSMTLPEIEALRAFNIAFHEAGLGNALYHRLMHFGASAYLRQGPPAAGEARIEVPAWALDRSAEIAREMVDRMKVSGVRIIGDLARLAPAAPEPRAATPDRTAADRTVADRTAPVSVCIPPVVAAALAAGVAVATGAARGSRANEVARSGGPSTILGGVASDGPRVDRPHDADRSDGLARFATYQLGGVVGMRLVAALVRAIERRGRPAGPVVAARPPGASEAEALDALGAWLTESGLSARVVSDVRAAAAKGLTSAPPPSEAGCLAPESAAALAFGVMLERGPVTPAGDRHDGRLRPLRVAWAEPPELAVLTSLQLLRAVARRVVGRVVGRPRGRTAG